jgi:hypothetical protein
MKAKKEPTKVYGASDDLIEFDGGYSGEVGCFGTDDKDHGVLVVMSDGTMLDVQYGKNGEGIWGIKLVKTGSLFERIDQCDSDDSDPHSDVAHFKAGITWAYAATEWEKVN